MDIKWETKQPKGLNPKSVATGDVVSFKNVLLMKMAGGDFVRLNDGLAFSLTVDAVVFPVKGKFIVEVA